MYWWGVCKCEWWGSMRTRNTLSPPARQPAHTHLPHTNDNFVFLCIYITLAFIVYFLTSCIKWLPYCVEVFLVLIKCCYKVSRAYHYRTSSTYVYTLHSTQYTVHSTQYTTLVSYHFVLLLTDSWWQVPDNKFLMTEFAVTAASNKIIMRRRRRRSRIIHVYSTK